MELSNEDKLRLNVLLAQPLKAIRINEGTMTVHALSEQGEAKVKLNPTLKDEQYLRLVRELLSLKITGSPGGYPIFLKRWTRMGHTDNTLEHMLLLGEPEAVVAVVHAQDLTHDIATSAWWANPTTEVAMRLLEYPAVVEGTLGQELATYLLEFLPFEEKQLNIVNMVRLCLQDELISEADRESLWSRAKRRNPFYVGFLHVDNTHKIPLQIGANPYYPVIEERLSNALENNNIYAQTLLYLLSDSGQKWLKTLQLALKKPVDQDVVISLFIAINQRLKVAHFGHRGVRDIQDALHQAETLCLMPNDTLCEITDALDDDGTLLEKFKAMLLLCHIGEDTLIPVFGGNDSVGTVMRKRLAPLTMPLLEKIDILMH